MRTVRTIALVVCASLVAGCGEKEETATPVTFGPGVKETSPPWKPEYTHLRERMATNHIPPPGKQKFHHHAQLHIYDDGRLIPVPAQIGIGKTAAGIHTHAAAGVIHVEATHPFKATLGDFFTIWGVPFGPKQVGNLVADGDNQVHVYVNGKPLVGNPIDYEIKNNDNIVVGYGTTDSFPHKPDTTALKLVQEGKAEECAVAKKGENPKSCTAQR